MWLTEGRPSTHKKIGSDTPHEYSWRRNVLKWKSTPTRVPNTTLQQTSSPDINTVFSTQYNREFWITKYTLTSDNLPIITNCLVWKCNQYSG